MRILVILAVVGGVGLAAPPSFLWQAELSWELPTVTFSLTTKMELLWTLPLWAWKSTVEIEDGLWTNLTFSGSGKIGFLEVFPSISFNPRDAEFSGASLNLKSPFAQGFLEGVTRVEEKGFGWGLSYTGGRGEALQRLRLRFNLKRYLDEVLEESFSPEFSFLEALFRVPLECCNTTLYARFAYTKAGFE